MMIVFPLLRRGRMTKNRLLKAMGEDWAWPVRHLRKRKKVESKKRRQLGRRNMEREL